MKLLSTFLIALGLALTLAATDSRAEPNPENTLIMELADGTVTIEMLPDLAPKHVERIRELTRQGFYNGVVFHRVIDSFMAQTGDPTGTGRGGSGQNISAEFTAEPFVRGVVGMARGQSPNSADSQFFIVFDDAQFLNKKYTVWGKVIDGMDAVDRIKKAPPSSLGGTVDDPDKIVSLKVQADVTVDKTDQSKGPVTLTRLPAPIPAQQTIQTGQYHALIIGVEDYQHNSVGDLNEPLKDARKIKQILESKYTFESHKVRLLSNPTRKEILDELDRLSKALSEQDNLLIFYSGHGYWDQQISQGYWLPSDALKNSRANWISNGTIRDYINGIKTKHTLLISDACFSGGIFKTKKAFSDVSAATNTLYSLRSRKAMTSGTRNEEVPDKSIFLKYLKKRLLNNSNEYITAQQLFSQFRVAVINNSPTHQVPQFGVIRESGDEGGDFIFVRR